MDVVITYVNGADKSWQASYSKFVKKPIEEARYRDWGTMPYLVRGIRKYMTYIDKIFIVVADASQVPAGVDLKDVRIIYHKDIIPEKYLPCFNSDAIEMFLYKIPELSEQFIYFNDDMFVLQPTEETDFFVDGKPVLAPKLVKYNAFDTFGCYLQHCINVTDILVNTFKLKSFPKNTYIVQEHRMRPFLKSSCEKVWENCSDAILHSLTRVRHERNFNAYLFNNYDYLMGNYVMKRIPYKMILTSYKIENIYNYIAGAKYKILCMNDDSNINFAQQDKLHDAFNANLNTKLNIINTVINNNEIVNFNNTKIAVCAIGKNENLYIREWVEYNKKIGIDKIFLYDNNDFDGEHFEDVINDYVKSNFVSIINVRGEFSRQVTAYDECYHTFAKDFDWILYIDIDEFINLDKKYVNIKQFVNDDIFSSFNCIRICWKQFTDNNIIKPNGDYSVKKFTEFLPIDTKWTSNSTKSLIKTNIDDIKMSSPHGAWCDNVISCNTLGEPCINHIFISNNTWDNCCLNHYRFKTIEEYVLNKMVKGWPTLYGNGGKDKLTLDFFFKFNNKTNEKEQYANQLLENFHKEEIYINGWFKFNEAGIIKQNLGDELNFYLLPKLIHKNILPYRNIGKLINETYADKDNYLCIGSIISNRYMNKNSIIWGAGMISDKRETSKNLTYPKKIYAVRGPLTRNVLLKQNIECPDVYGDPALLLPYIYNPMNIKKTHKIGFIKHYKTLFPFDTLIKNDTSMCVIDMTNYNVWTDVIDQILSCEYIVSESLHGLIIAEAYNIPNLWVDINLEANEHSSFKFHDFFMSLGEDRLHPYRLSVNTTPNELLNELSKYKRVFNIDLQKLIDSCPFEIKIQK